MYGVVAVRVWYVGVCGLFLDVSVRCLWTSLCVCPPEYVGLCMYVFAVCDCVLYVCFTTAFIASIIPQITFERVDLRRIKFEGLKSKDSA